MHKNGDRARDVARRYDSGLIWMDAHSSGVNWSQLHPNVVVNRFPRDENSELKLCGRAMAGQRGFDEYYPRAYPAADVDRFVKDYSLTACVSLLRAFVDGDGVKCTKNGQVYILFLLFFINFLKFINQKPFYFSKVPLSVLYFAVNKCDTYLAYGEQTRDDLFSGDGDEWTTFFGQYYKIAHDYQKFGASADDREEGNLRASCRRLLHKLSAWRPQMAIDGHRNIWAIKSTGSRSGLQQPLLVNKMDDALEKLSGHHAATADCVVQKYVETPLLLKNTKFDVHAWIAVTTLDGCLTVWLYRSCSIQHCAHRFSLDVGTTQCGVGIGGGGGRPRHDHFASARPDKLEAYSAVRTCALKQLKGRLRSEAGAAWKSAGDANNVSTTIKRSVVTAILQAAATVLNLRPNCVELFRATFVLSVDARPWLIDIKSDPCLAHTFNRAMSLHTSGVAKSLAKIIIANKSDRLSYEKIGMFDVVHRNSIPGTYVPRAFFDRPVSRKREKSDKGMIRANHKELYDCYNAGRHWESRPISTYIEQIKEADVQMDRLDHCASATFEPDRFAADTSDGGTEAISMTNDTSLCLVHLKESLARLKTGTNFNSREANVCLRLLDKWKMRVESAQKFYRYVITTNEQKLESIDK